jgi:hypothetical protein
VSPYGKPEAGVTRPAWRWKLSGAAAEKFLTTLVPCLREKRAQALIWLALRCTEADEVSRRRRLVGEIKALKRPVFTHNKEDTNV